MKRLTSNAPLTEAEAMNLSVTNLYARLKEYEDTGLEPEEVAYFLGTTMSVKEAKAQYAEHKKRYDEYMAWKKAKSEGRLLILPCKVGDTVYLIKQVMIGTKSIFDARVNGISVSYAGDVILHFGGHPPVSYCASSIGKTVFLTREEAEAALRKENDT